MDSASHGTIPAPASEPRTDQLSDQPSGSARARRFDIVLFGATGYVGRLIAAELVRVAPDRARIGLAGRDATKVTEVARAVGLPDASVVVADAFDARSLDAMAREARVVIATVGPYTKYGAGAVRACVAAGTHYVDLNGEVAFARETADQYDEAAKAAGISVVTACGFDSVPSDLGVLLAAEAAREADAGELGQTTLHVRELVGGLSGGTVDALRTQIRAGRTRRPAGTRRTWSASDPYALSPDRAAEPEPRPRHRGSVWLETSADTGEFAAPFAMARYNAQIVRRSNALLGWRYGRGLRYREVHDTGRGARGLVRGLGSAAVLPAFVIALATPGLGRVADRVLPAPGEGPGEKLARTGRFRMEVHATTSSARRVVATVADRREPGYRGTAVMIAQAALALLGGEGLATGVSTPAAALGMPYVERLRAQGFTLDVVVE